MRIRSLIVALFLAGAVSLPAAAAPSVKCEMKFTLSGWSAFYKTASGNGLVTCSNGETARVKLTAKGGGITFGKSTITDAIGKFSEVNGIGEVFGTYVQAEAHAGAVKSSNASAMTKGEVSLALSGTGQGVDLGISFGKFVIEKK